MNVATKLSGAFVLLLLLMIGLLMYHVRTVRGTVETGYELSEISSRMHLTTTGLLSPISQLDESASKFLVTGDRGYLALFNEAADEFAAALRELEGLPLDEVEREEVSRLVEAWEAFLPVANQLDALGGEESSQVMAWAYEQLDRLRFRAEGMSRASQELMTDRLISSAEAARRAERLSWIGGVLAIVMSFLVAITIVGSISQALTRLKSGTHAVAQGDFDHRFRTLRKDEFAEVEEDFNRMTRKLGELDQMKQDFVAKISHDLKAPLASIRETNALLLEEISGPLTPDQRELLTLGAESGNHLSSMIAKLLNLSGLEGGALQPERVTYDFGALVQGAVRQCQLRGSSHEVTVTASVPERPLLVEGDEDLITQVLSNLLENALKFSPEGGQIEVEVEFVTTRPETVPETSWAALQGGAGSGTVFVTVLDEGPGIPEDERELVFDRFYQTDEGRKARGRGIGLGLTICREIVRAHGGAIWVDTTETGGARVMVLLPRALLMPREDVEEAPLAAGSGFNREIS